MELALVDLNILIISNVERLPPGFFDFDRKNGINLHIIDYRKLSTFDWNSHSYNGVILSGTDYAPHLYPDLYEDEQRLIRSCSIPLLAICGGFQILCKTFGATVSDTKNPVYGRTRVVALREDDLWEGLPMPFNVFSKHKYAITDEVNDFNITARNESGEFVYGIRHKSQPFFGVQFHPERRHDGTLIMNNFFKLVRQLNT